MKQHKKPTPELRDGVRSESKLGSNLFYPHKEVLREIQALEWVEKIVEYWAGTGADLMALHQMWYDVTYADFSPTARDNFAKQLKTNNVTGIQIDHSDVLDIQYDDNQFDLVYHCGLIEHFLEADRKKIMEGTIRITSKYLIVDFPNTLSGHTVAKKILMALGKRPYGDETNFTYRQFKNRALENFGDQLEYVWFYGRELLPLPRKMKEGMWRPDINISALNYLKGSVWIIFKKKQ